MKKLNVKNRNKILKDYSERGYELVSDDGKILVFREKFNWIMFSICLVFLPIVAVIYLIWHFNKEKIFVEYKK